MRSKDEKLMNALNNEGNANEYMSLNPVVVPKQYAPKSSLYGKVMDDGYVFNPFIHRRWLPAQFEKLNRDKENDYSFRNEPMNEYMASKYTYGYSVKFVVDEVNKLNTLQKHDLCAYEERKSFFDMDTIKVVLIDYIDSLFKEIHVSQKYNYNYWSFGDIVNNPSCFQPEEAFALKEGYYTGSGNSGIQKVKCFDYEKHLDKLEEISNKIQKAKSLFDIYRAINIEPRYFDVKKQYKGYGGRTFPDAKFIEAFWKSGAYYTLKYKIMFDHIEFQGCRGAEACRKLRGFLDEGYSAEQFQKLYDEVK